MRHLLKYADDSYESIPTLFRLRAPSLAVGLLLGIVISFITSRFEETLSHNIHLIFFLPFVIYVADAVGTQTESIYSRNLKDKKTSFRVYFYKEGLLWLLFWALFGGVSSLIIRWWLHDPKLCLSVWLATFCAVATAPIIALIVTQSFQHFHEDPAAGSGPITTVIQDLISIVIYGLVASLVVL